MQPILLLKETDDGTLVITLNPAHHNPLIEVQAVADRDAVDALTELMADSGHLQAWAVKKDCLNSPDGDIYPFPSDICYSLLGHGEVALEGEESEFEPTVHQRETEWYTLQLRYNAKNTLQAKKMAAEALENGDLESLGWDGDLEPSESGSDTEIAISGAFGAQEISFYGDEDPFYYKDVSKQRAFLWCMTEHGRLVIEPITPQGIVPCPSAAKVTTWGVLIAEPTEKEVTRLTNTLCGRPTVGDVIEDLDYGRLEVLFVFLNPQTL